MAKRKGDGTGNRGSNEEEDNKRRKIDQESENIDESDDESIEWLEVTDPSDDEDIEWTDVTYAHKEEQVDLNHLNKDGDSRLHTAINRDDREAVNDLIYRGANLNLPDSEGRTPLYLAILRGRLDIAKLLIRAGANLDENPLLELVMNKARNESLSGEEYLEIAEILLDRNPALVKQFESNGATLLHLATRLKDLKLANRLLNEGLDINAEDMFGETPLSYAILYHRSEMTEFLLNEGARLDLLSSRNKTILLHQSVSDGRPNTAIKVIQEGADPSVLDSNARTALLCLAIPQELFYSNAIEQLLIGLKSDDLNTETEYGMPLHMAAAKGESHIVKLLIAAGADPNIQDSDGETPLQIAAEKGNLQVVKELMKIPSVVDSLNVKNEDGDTPLHLAAKEGKLRVVKELMKYQAAVDNLNSKNIDGETPLLLAVRNNQENVVKWLLTQDNIDVNIQDNEGYGVLHYASENLNEEMYNLLCRHGARDPNVSNTTQKTNSTTPPSSPMLQAAASFVNPETPNPGSPTPEPKSPGMGSPM